ncbi:MAG TPA: AAA family ATPase [Firmicutes bacterium]|jgi:broad-specificity NMP kinase|nr:AAA family ATPase [Bacillota bacterium]
MKRLYLIGGTMGVGKTAVCKELKARLNRSVFLDGDWCWDANPFQVTEETKAMVMANICFLLDQFIHCSAYDHIIFCWVMHEQSIIDGIVSRLDTANCEVKAVSLMCSEKELRERLEKDIAAGRRTRDIMGRSLARLPLYHQLDTVKINTDGKTVREVAEEIACL